MIEHLERCVFELVAGNIEEAKKHHSAYVTEKAKSLMNEEEKLEPALVKGHCDSCGEPATASKNMLANHKWMCGHCEGKKFVPSSK